VTTRVSADARIARGIVQAGCRCKRPHLLCFQLIFVTMGWGIFRAARVFPRRDDVGQELEL
jgi:hypothetical protein